ncbi:hypothetical protein DXG01_009119 [Tephrocybe rancida]|nr:hypothetical protein DXG01_009119 [Tephrocybe rancida]
MRSLVDEICGWAAVRLQDGRWRFRNRKVEGEIADFRARLDDARQVFNARSLIVISGGLGAIFQFMRATFLRQDMFMVTLEKLKKSQDEIVIRILKEQKRQKALEEELGSWTVPNATYSLQNKKPCSPDTRMEILDTIETWLDDHSEKTSKNFLWLVGPPGCGKSAIMASVVRKCKARRIAAAQFFINRNDPNTTNPIKYFPTVVREVAKQSDEVEQQLHDSVKGHSFSVDTPEEAAELFIDVVGKAAKNNPSIPILVIFDGLDETTRDRLEDTAATFSKLFSKLPDYPNAKILISSRPEDEILKSFRNTDTPLEQHVLELAINIYDSDSRRDVRTYFQRRLAEIAMKRGLSSAVWPGDERLEKLVERASGLFIWAVTAVNYIHNLLRIRGKEVMDSALAQFDNKAMTDINTLYLTILENAYPEAFSDEWTFETFRRLLGAMMVLREPMNVGGLGYLLDLRETPGREPVDVLNFVEHLRPLLVADVDDITEYTFPGVHKSFFDYLTSAGEHIPERFYINVQASNAELALACLRQLTSAYPIVRSTQYASSEVGLMELPTATLYSLSHAFSHMPRLDNGRMSVVLDHKTPIDMCQFDGLLQRSCHSGYAGPLVLSVPSYNTFVRTSFEHSSLIWNPRTWSATTPIQIDSPAPDLSFSENGNRVFCHSLVAENGPIMCAPNDSYNLKQSISVEVSMRPEVTAFTFSFDGTKVVMGCQDGTASLHTIDPHVTLGALPIRHREKITTLAISRNLSYIASASRTETFIWDITGEYSASKRSVIPHRFSVESIVFSPDETLLISSDTTHICVWEADTCRQKHSFAFRRGGPKSLAFSPDSKIVLAGSMDGHVFLWNFYTDVQFDRSWKLSSGGGPTNVYTVAFRSCGNIALACCNNFVYVLKLDRPGEIPLIVTRDNFSQAVFTPDGSQLLTDDGLGDLTISNISPLLLHSARTFKPEWTLLSLGGRFVVSASANEILCWRLDAVKVIGNPLKGETPSFTIVAICFSADESRIVGADEDGMAYYWDSNTLELLSSLPKCVLGASSLSFSLDSDIIVATLKNNRRVVLKVKNDVLSVPGEGEISHALQKFEATPKSTFFDLDSSPITFDSDLTVHNRRLKGIRWYPSRCDSLILAYVNNYIIRGGKDGTFVIIPVGDISFK